MADLELRWALEPTPGTYNLQFGSPQTGVVAVISAPGPLGSPQTYTRVYKDALASVMFVGPLGAPHLLLVDQKIKPHSTSHSVLSSQPSLSVRTPLSAHSTTHAHFSRWKYLRLDLFYRSQELVNAVSTRVLLDGAVWFRFNQPFAQALAFGIHSFEAGSTTVENSAQGAVCEGFESSSFGRSFAAFTPAYLLFTLRGLTAKDLASPLELDFKELPPALLIHNARHVHRSTLAQLAVLTPLVLHAATHKHTTQPPALTHTSPLNSAHAAHQQSAAHVRVAHTIPMTGIDHAQHEHFVQHTSVAHRVPARAHSVVHHQWATNIVVTHLSPLVINNGTQAVVSEQIFVRNWAPLALADAWHGHVSQHTVLYVWAALVLADTRHSHRSMRLSFLPLDWIFRQVIGIEPDSREFVLDPEDRLVSLMPEAREGVLPPEDRTLTIPPEIRTVELESIGRASSVER